MKITTVVYLELRVYKRIHSKVQYQILEVEDKLKKFKAVSCTDYPTIFVRGSDEVERKGYLVTYDLGEPYISICRVSFEIVCVDEVEAKSKIEEVLQELPDTFAVIEVRQKYLTEIQAI